MAKLNFQTHSTLFRNNKMYRPEPENKKYRPTPEKFRLSIQTPARCKPPSPPHALRLSLKKIVSEAKLRVEVE